MWFSHHLRNRHQAQNGKFLCYNSFIWQRVTVGFAVQKLNTFALISQFSSIVRIGFITFFGATIVMWKERDSALDARSKHVLKSLLAVVSCSFSALIGDRVCKFYSVNSMRNVSCSVFTWKSIMILILLIYTRLTIRVNLQWVKNWTRYRILHKILVFSDGVRFYGLDSFIIF